MSEFLSRIKARLETGQHLNSVTSEDPAGWVRAALSGMDMEPIDLKEGPKEVVTSVELSNGWQTDLVERMKVVGLGSQDGQESPSNLTVFAGNPVSDNISARDASQKLWDTGSLESRIPDGFYSVIPSNILKAQFMTIPTLDELKKPGVEGSTADVLLVDTNEDKVLEKLKELAISAVKTVGTNPALIIKKIAELVADFYGGAIFEGGASKIPVDEALSGDCTVQLLGKIGIGLCRPRAILFKVLGDAVGLHSRLLMGLQLEAAPTSSVICANPNKHLSNIVGLNGMELLVDVMRHPGHLRPFSRKALIMYHISGAGDSDSADYDSCDSPLEPNSPLCGYAEKLESESPDHETDSPRVIMQRRHTSPVAARSVHNMMLRIPMSLEGKLSPSRSEPDLCNPYRRRNSRRKADEGLATFSPERAVSWHQLQWKVNAEGVRSFPSSPEHPQARIRSFRRVGSEEGSISSSPEHPTFRVRAPSMLGGSRRQGGEEVDTVSVSSPEQSPQYFSSTGTPSPMYRRRRERSLSIDIQRDGLSSDFFRTSSELEFPRINHSPDVRRPRKRGVAPEISDDVVRVVREMNEKLKQERHRSKASTEEQSKNNSDIPNAEQGNEVEEGSSPAEKVHLRTASDPTSLQSTPGPFVVDDQEENSHDEREHGVDKKSLESESTDLEKESTAESSVIVNHTVPPKPPDWLNGPLMPFPEWQIDYNELRIDLRVGIGSFGEVFHGMWRGTEVAIKRLLEQDFTEENTADFYNEISLLSRLRHPNVILFMGACTTPPYLSMVTEYMHLGSLYSLVHKTGHGKKLSYRRRLKMLRDICRGMMSVQRLSIVHRDLKSANCLVDKHYTVKICDFGLSRLANGPVQDSTAAGTPEWMAPELLRNEPVTDKCDVFSLGVIMWELCTLQRPWKGVEPMQVVYKVAHTQARLEIPDGLLGRLIADCWAEVPSQRPSYDDILARLDECEYPQS